MEERRVADYFVVAGLPAEPVEITDRNNEECTQLKPTHSLPPITDITVIFHSLGEAPPEGFTCITTTPTGHSASLTTGAWKSSEVYLCFKRGLDKPPLVDIGVIYDGKERIMSDSQVVRTTPENRPASITSSTAAKTFVTFRRAPERMPCNQLVVTDVCVINPGRGEVPPHAFCLIDKSLNKNFIGTSGAYICYKKSMHRPTSITYKPGVLARYPKMDHPYFPFPENVSMFCLPMGATIECWPAEAAHPKPLFSTFVLTMADGSEMIYGSAITFYECVPEDNLNPTQRKQLKLDQPGKLRSVNANKSICLLSHWPFFDAFEKFLKFLYKMTCDGPHNVPVERYISYFLENVPFPSQKRPRILFQLSAVERLILTQPEDLPLPRSGAGFCALLSNLGPENCLTILLLALTEQKIVVHSLRPDVLTAVAEAISMIIFPFKWQCPYIPLCPLGLAYVLQAPLPFLIGVDSRFFDLYDPSPEISYIDLDTNSITINQSGDDRDKGEFSSKILPKKAARNLLKTLQRLFSKIRQSAAILQPSVSRESDLDDASIDLDFVKKRKEQALEVEIQEAFLHFMASVLKGYRNYLLPITKAPKAGATDPSSLFDLEGFKRSRDKAHYKFFDLIMRTQMFIKFIEERSFVSTMDASLAFFDDCSERVGTSDDNDALLIELDDPEKSENTVFIMPPEPNGLPADASYSYRGFVLNPLLFNQNETEFLGVPTKDNLLSMLPGSPVAKRTKHEIRVAQKMARKSSTLPKDWAKCLLSTCYSIWFIHLPSHILNSHLKPQTMQKAFDLLQKLHKLRVQPSDEVCYRVVMQLCGLYNMPVLAVKLLFLMKRSGMQPNAITYGFYNRAVLEAAWPSDISNSSQLLWAKLRNVVLGVALFRRAARTGLRRRLSLSSERDLPALPSTAENSISEPLVNAEVAQPVEQTPIVVPESVGVEITEPTETAAVSDVQPIDATEAPKESPGAESTENAEVDSASRIRPRVSSIVKAPTPVSPNPESPGLPGEGTVELRRQISVPGNEAFRRRHYSGSDFSRVREHRPTTADSTDCMRMLRSESFANDAQILEKLGQLKLVMAAEEKQKAEAAGRAKMRGKLGVEAGRSESQDLEQAVMDFMEEGEDAHPLCVTPPKAEASGTRRKLLSPARTIITRNDPLGALDAEQDADEDIVQLPPSVEQSPAKNWIAEEGAGGPVLFKDSGRAMRRKTDDKFTPPPVLRTATSHYGLGMEKSQSPSSCADSDDIYMDDGEKRVIQRSSTLPASPSSMVARTPGVSASPTVSSSLGSLSSSFKLPFRRYSPARLSLRKPDFNLLENAQNAITQHFSPGSLTGKRTGEMLMNLKSAASTAATSMAKKFDEIKEVISSNTTPVKGYSPHSHYLPSSTRENSVMDEEDGLERSRNASFSNVNEFSPLGSMHYAADYWGSNLLDLFGAGGADSSRKGSATNLYPSDQGSNLSLHSMLPEKIYQRREETGSAHIALEIEMTTCSRCHYCASIMYDEEIMAGWVPDDSNLNTRCQHCEKSVVPFLVVSILDFREAPTKDTGANSSPIPVCASTHSLQELAAGKNALLSPDRALTDSQRKKRTRSRSESQLDGQSDDPPPAADVDPVSVEPVTVPYLNPLVLRKEVESILDNEGDCALNKSSFVDEHPIIYWNLVWVFQRIDVESHLPLLCLDSVTVSKNTNIHSSWRQLPESPGVLIRCMWENTQLFEESGRPMHLVWQQMQQLGKPAHQPSDISLNAIQVIIKCVKVNDLLEPMNLLAAERRDLRQKGIARSYSVYRDILFLAFTALGRENIDQMAFDEEYRIAYDKLTSKELKMYLPCDQPLTNYSVCCRHYFRELDL